MQIYTSNAINSLGDWEFVIWNEDLSTIKFYSDSEEISAPADFPNEADIEARRVDMQTKADTGNYKSVQEIIATY